MRSRLKNLFGFLAAIPIGLTAGGALAVAEDVELDIKKRIQAHRTR